jgi:hypothetical protein
MENASFIQWLLEAQTPSIRYLTLRRLKNLPETDERVREARLVMGREGPIPAILAEQDASGGWKVDHSYYTPKYTSTHWSMLLLAELAAGPADPALQRGANYMLDAPRLWWLRREEKGAHGIACFWGNQLRYALHAGRQDNPNLPKVIDMLVYDALDAGWRCEYNDERPCAWGAARALWGLAALPDGLRTAEVDAAILSGLDFLLKEHSLVEADYPVPENGKIHSLWGKLSFPLFYQADILFVLRVLGELGELGHPGARPALEWLESRRGRDGRWRGSSPYRQRTWLALGDRGETDRWVSLQAAIILGQS